jgi:chemotaxis protein MotB
MVRKRSRQYSRPSRDRWLVSYADFITLLFALFVVLFAASNADDQRAGRVAKAVKGAFHSFGVFAESGKVVSLFEDEPNSTAILVSEDLDSTADVGPVPFPSVSGNPQLDELTAILGQKLRGTIENGALRLSRDSRGLTISLTEAGFFAPGSAVIQAEAYAVVDQIAEIIRKVSNNVRVEGHTDNTPIHTAQFPSNWELSTARATHLLQYLIATASIPPQRLSAVGYGEYHPVVSNNTIEGRAANRRVDLVILSATAEKLEPDNSSTE